MVVAVVVTARPETPGRRGRSGPALSRWPRAWGTTCVSQAHAGGPAGFDHDEQPVVGVLALTSMANAGVPASSRFPLAMSRGSLAPELFTRVDERFKTPPTPCW